ncbi:hypothetical protein [Phytopseudomonas dryadis]|uniref:Uncharacterized protein n=1 Tax=Phytopseudomonas dryadis TaxID=2487520 RepID=A0A4V2KB14_9GAMM|nr:hypothetical protein [Pseudomonas dryadis]TBU81686.1 hypothetical protein DNK44_26160 [Pseudomonas dryadis]
MNAQTEIDSPNQAAPLSFSQLREALAFVTNQYDRLYDTTADVLSWLWEAIQGDFNQNRSTGQIVFDTAISMIPGVDQVCDVRDLVANCKEIHQDKSNTWAWISLGLTLIGLFPTLGSLIKGVLKIFFLYIRRLGLNQLIQAVDAAMDTVIALLRRQEVQRYWSRLGWDNVFTALARETRAVRDMVSLDTLLAAFDRGIALLLNLVGMVKRIPVLGARAERTVNLVRGIRDGADAYLAKALRPLHEILDAIIRRLELEELLMRRGIVDVGNVHFHGALPQPRALELMRREPPPSWLRKGTPTENLPLEPQAHRQYVDEMADQGYPKLTDQQIASFADLLEDELKGPKRLYRVIGPGSSATRMDWVTEETFNALQKAADPKAAWRQYLAVWPDWNPNGQFVVYDIKVGETLKVWRGKAASQVLEEGLPDRFLAGGLEQIKFDASLIRGDAGKILGQAADDLRFLRVNRATGRTEPAPDMTYRDYEKLPAEQQLEYETVRQQINHPAVSGPFDTGWGYTDFDAQMLDARLGLPALPGQLSQLALTETP